MRLPIHMQREIARLHFYDPKQSNRAIGRILSISPNTVDALRAAIFKAKKSWEELQQLDDVNWTVVLGTTNHSIAQRKTRPDWQWVYEEMQKPNATLEQLWQEFRTMHPEGIGYSQFANNYRIWHKSLNIVMRQAHSPGSKLFVDFAGDTIEIKDKTGGSPTHAQIFVAVLGYSNFSFVYGVASQKSVDWIRCHIECFKAFGGVPEWVVPDNLKAAVSGRKKDDISIHPAYRECLKHYDTAPMPTRPRRPRDKGKVEVGVQLVQRGIVFPLRNHVFFSLDELNAVLKERVKKLNAHPFKKMPGSREQRFIDTEQKHLKPLPAAPYEICEWRYGVRVGDDYHVEHDRSFYSVPFQFSKQRVDLRYTATMLEIMQGGQRIAIHQLVSYVGEIKTNPEHRPVAHTRILEGEPRSLMLWAETVGENATAMIRYHLEDRTDLTNGLKAARRMREYSRAYGNQRFEDACKYALSNNMTALRSMKFILRESPDKNPSDSGSMKTYLAHENVRGADYFGETA